MPRKTRNMSAQRNRQVLQQIKSRLMQISFRLDDYVYRDRLIPTSEALAYIDEIAEFKAQCMGDPPSMQVIEKLTRCMNGIVHEEQIVNREHLATENTYNEVNRTQTCISPTYSLPDEELPFAQAAQANRDECKAKEANNERENNDVIVLSDDDAINEGNVTMSIDVEVHRAMSNLSMEDTDTVLQSQSILANFDQGYKFPLNSAVTAKNIVRDQAALKTSTVELTQPTAIQFQSILKNTEERNANSYFIDNLKENAEKRFMKNVNGKQESLVQKVKNNLLKGQDAKSNKENISSQAKTVKFVVPTKTITQVPVNKNYPIPITEPFKNNSSAKVEPVKEKTKRQKNQSANKGETKSIRRKRNTKKHVVNSKLKDTDAQLKGDNNKILKRAVTKTNTYPPATIQPKGNSKYTNVTIPTIYKESTKDDLSWIENIRYVREISSAEFDPKLANIEDGFWGNLTFPGDWNDLDFEVC